MGLGAARQRHGLVARNGGIGGDEFAVLLPNTDAEGATACAQKITEALLPPFSISGIELESKTSIGIAVYPEDGPDVQTLLKHADTAMYEAKSSGRRRIVVFDEDLRRRALAAQRLPPAGAPPGPAPHRQPRRLGRNAAPR